MRKPALRHCALLLWLLLVTASTVRAATEPMKEKTWTFQSQSGTVKIKASQFERDDNHKPFTALDLWIEGGKSNIEEEGHFLSSALDEMPKAGFALSTLSHLIFRLERTDASQRIAIFAATSSTWNSVSRTGIPAKVYPAVTSMLNESGAFREWIEAFHAHGVGAKIVGVEKVMIIHFNQTGMQCPAKMDCAHIRVPYDALTQMDFYPISQK